MTVPPCRLFCVFLSLQPFYTWLGKQTKMDHENISNIWKISDTLFCEVINNVHISLEFILYWLTWGQLWNKLFTAYINHSWHLTCDGIHCQESIREEASNMPLTRARQGSVLILFLLVCGMTWPGIKATTSHIDSVPPQPLSYSGVSVAI